MSQRPRHSLGALWPVLSQRPSSGASGCSPVCGTTIEAARIRRRVAKPVLRLRGDLAVHLPLERDDRHFKPRREVIFQFLALARITGRRLHLLRAAFDVKAAEFRNAGIARGGIGQTFGIDPEVLRVFDDVRQFVEARAHGMGPVFPRRAGHLDKPLVAVMGDRSAHPHQRLALKAATHPVHFAADGRRPKAPNPVARDLIRLPRRVTIGILHAVHAGCDHLADQSREGRGTGRIERGTTLGFRLLEANPFPSAVFLDEVKPALLRL